MISGTTGGTTVVVTINAMIGIDVTTATTGTITGAETNVGMMIPRFPFRNGT